MGLPWDKTTKSTWKSFSGLGRVGGTVCANLRRRRKGAPSYRRLLPSLRNPGSGVVFTASSVGRPRCAGGGSRCELRIHDPCVGFAGGVPFLVRDKQAAVGFFSLGLNGVDHLWTLRPNIAAAAASVVVLMRPYVKYPPGAQGVGFGVFADVPPT